MNTTTHTGDLPYEKEALLLLFDDAAKYDVEEDGRYDRRGGAINVWSHSWTNDTLREASDNHTGWEAISGPRSPLSKGRQSTDAKERLCARLL